ncbi:MAG: hypothetical protein ABFS14_07590 [Gemmatimonadota bacterium]
MLAVVALLSLAAAAPTGVAGGPEYADAETRRVVEEMVRAHGGMEAWNDVDRFNYRFFTKSSNSPEPFLSTETVQPATGLSHIEWPVFGAQTAFDGEEVWSQGWPMPIPAGFFARLTFSFISLPFLTQQDGVKLALEGMQTLPNEEGEFLSILMHYPTGGASVPGTYYRIFVDPASKLMKAVEFDIAHPGMAASPTQPLGPIWHVFGEYRRTGGLVIPAYYQTYGLGAREMDEVVAVHHVFNLSVDGEFDESLVEKPEGAEVDMGTVEFWRARGQ